MTNPAGTDVPIKIRIRKPADVLALLPYLIGFHPADSLCVVGLKEQAVTCAFRCDLPGLDDLETFASALAETITAKPVGVALLVGYGRGHAVTPVVAAARAAMATAGIPVVDALRAQDGRYWSYLCVDLACCPPEGTPYDVGASAVAATAVASGLTALPGRDDLVAGLRPDAESARTAMRDATDRVAGELDPRLRRPGGAQGFISDVRRIVHDALERYENGGRIDDAEAARLSVLLGSIRLRDEAWVAIRPDRLAPQLLLWRDMTRRATVNVAACASLLAFTAWQDGNGALANIAVDRAMEADPGYRMAALMARVLAAALPPDAGAAMLTADDLATYDPPGE